MGRLYVVGLTGPTGAGKTTVSRFLAQNGYPVIDADIVAREAVLPNTRCLQEIRQTFGEAVIHPDGSLNRRALGDIVFADNIRLKQLEQILYPGIIARIDDRLKQYRQDGVPVVILDAPTLFESGADSMCGRIIVVMAPRKTRIARIMARDNLSEKQAMERITAQHNDAFYLDRADYVVDNTTAVPDYTALLDWLAGILNEK